jgi:Lon protease-like protein
MILDCVQEHKSFGVVLAKPESEHLREIPYSAGTIVEIRNLEQLEDGRYTLIAIGKTRFRILSQHREKPYLSGLVEPFDDVEEAEQDVAATMEQAQRLFENYLKMLLEALNEQETEADLPETPQDLSYFIADFIDIADERKQELLEMTSTRQRLECEVAVLRREVPVMRQILSMPPSDKSARLN